MIPRLILTATLLQIGGWAQLQLFHFDGTNDIPVAGLYDAGTAATCDKLVTRFHIRNVGPQDVSVLINVAGSGFTFAVNGLNPSKIASQQQLEFDVTFTPTATADFAATITASALSAIIKAKGIAAPCVSFDSTQLSAGAAADFGIIAWGNTISKSVTLSNPSTSGPLSVGSVTVSGDAFQGP